VITYSRGRPFTSQGQQHPIKDQKQGGHQRQDKHEKREQDQSKKGQKQQVKVNGKGKENLTVNVVRNVIRSAYDQKQHAQALLVITASQDQIR
jgi:Cu/Zn superoxide dismutase